MKAILQPLKGPIMPKDIPTHAVDHPNACRHRAT